MWLILVQSYQEQQQGLQSRAERTQLYNDLENEIRNVLTGMEQESAAAKPSQRFATCTTAFCRSLPSRLAEINAASAKTSHPTNLQAPTNITYTQLSALQNQLNQALNTVESDQQWASDRQQAQAAFQAADQKTTQLFQVISTVEKTMCAERATINSALQ